MNSDQKPLMDQKKTKTSPFHWEFGRHLIHHRLGRSHSPPQMAPLYNYATKFPLVTTYNGRPTFTPKNCPFPWGRSPPQLLASSLDAANLPPQTASRYNQPFYHNTPDRQTDTQTHRPTDGLGDVTCTKTRLCSTDHGDAANNKKTSPVYQQFDKSTSQSSYIQLHHYFTHMLREGDRSFPDFGVHSKIQLRQKSPKYAH